MISSVIVRPLLKGVAICNTFPWTRDYYIITGQNHEEIQIVLGCDFLSQKFNFNKILLCSLSGSSKAPSSGTSGSSLSCLRCSVKARWRWSSTRAGVAETWLRGVYVCVWMVIRRKYESSLKWQIHFWHLVPIKSHLGLAFELWLWITLHGWVKSIVQSRPVICLREMLKYWY